MKLNKMKNHIEHKISIKSDGMGVTDNFFPICTCGWVGTKFPQYEDYAYTDAMWRKTRTQSRNQRK